RSAGPPDPSTGFPVSFRPLSSCHLGEGHAPGNGVRACHAGRGEHNRFDQRRGRPWPRRGGGQPVTGSLQATIRTTSHGIPHIVSNSYAGLGYGYGYSLAKDNICVLADIYVTVDGERSRYSGSSP